MVDFGVVKETECQVLVVEDEPRLRDMLLKAIPDMGFEAHGARSAEEALRLMENDAHQVMVLDLNLPGMSGLEFLKVVREKWPATGVVVLTGFGDLDAAKKAIHLDVVDFLTKPCPLGDLEVALDRARRRAQPPVDAVAQAQAALAATREQAAMASKPARPTPEEELSDESKVRKLDEVERLHILAALERNEGNRTATAKELGISLRTLYYRLSEYQKRGLLPQD